MIEVLDDPELRELRRDMTTWLRRAVIPAKLPGVKVPEMADLQEAKIMLAERAATWPQQWMAEGLREVLVEQFQEKFGAVEDEYAAQIAEASYTQLKRWLGRILSARSPSEVFES